MDEITLRCESMDILANNIKKLKMIFPDVFCEDKVDFQKLKETLGKYAIEDKQECYNLTWNGKTKAKRLYQTSSAKTLRPCVEESKNYDTTENLVIYGDNLEVLKLLQKSYFNKIKMIYIDPPYNTGNDFIYKDDFKDNLQNYLKITNQKDENGNHLVANKETSGRFHSDWLSFMYPRLLLARDLLKDDGVIFISIDDNEQANLKLICDEIFGEENFIANVVRKTKITSNSGRFFTPSHEYILVYGKQIDYCNMFFDTEAQKEDNYIKAFKYKDGYGRYKIVGLYQSALKHGGSRYPIKCPDGSYAITPYNKPWRWNEGTFTKNKTLDKVVFKQSTTSPLLDLKGNRAKWNIYTKIYLEDRLESGLRPRSFIDKYYNSEATRELKQISISFEFSKPVNLIKYIISLVKLDEDNIILDFFAGSGTTADAVMQLNAEDGGKRKFILVQLPELCSEKSEAFNAGYKTIADICKERIRRAGEKINKEVKEQNKQLKLDEEPKKIPDVGFKVLKLDTSNFKKWNVDVNNLEQNLDDMVNNYVDGRAELDIIYEVMLKYGIDLTYPIETLDINSKKLYSIGFGQLVICLELEITVDIAKEIVKYKKQKEVQSMSVVLKDSGFASDSVKINIKEILKLADIKNFITL